MEIGTRTGIIGIIIGAGLAVAALTVPWEIPILIRHILFWAGSFSALAAILDLIRAHFLRPHNELIKNGIPGIVMSSFVVLMAIVEQKPPVVHIAPPPTPKETPQSLLDNILAIGCFNTNVPKRAFDDKQLDIIELEAAGHDVVPAIRSYYPPGYGEINWGNDRFGSGEVALCNIKNYGKSTLFGVSVLLSIKWEYSVKIPEGERSGKTVWSEGFSSAKFNIESGINNLHTFYILNFGDQFVTVTVTYAGYIGEQKDKIKLRPGDGSPSVVLLPNHFVPPLPSTNPQGETQTPPTLLRPQSEK